MTTSTTWIGIKVSQLNHQSQRLTTAFENMWFFDKNSKVQVAVHKNFGEEVLL